MVSFRYEARGSSGGPVRGTIDAPDRRSAIDRLSEQGLIPSSLERYRFEGNGGEEAARERQAPRSEEAASTSRSSVRVRRKAVTAFTREMATLLSASIPILSALESLEDQEENESLRAVLEDLASAVRSGESLSSAMESHPRTFSKLYTSMVRVGEEAGELDKVMADLAELLEQQDEVRSEVLGAVAYPVFVLLMGIITAFVLLAFVLPRLFEMLEDMLEVLPLPTRILLGASDFFAAGWPWILAAACGGALIARAVLRTPDGRLAWDRSKLRLPVIGPVFRAAALARFSRTLGILSRSGVSLLPALVIARDTAGNRVISNAVDRVAEETRGGHSLAAPLRKLGVFPPTLVQMIAVGEETGHLSEMLLRVASIQERHLRARSRTLISFLAPFLILAVGGLVGFIVISLLLPIFQMSGAIR